jgi:DNA-binding NarL/FixJ family response regulator
MTIRVFLLDDHEIVRRGVRDLLTAEPDIEVVGEAGTATQALERIALDVPDVAVLDVQLPDSSGVEVCREIRSRFVPNVACVMLTSFAEDEALWCEAVVAGAAGYRAEAGARFERPRRLGPHGGWPARTLIDPMGHPSGCSSADPPRRPRRTSASRRR